jgi:hypothetical protein
MLNDHDIHIWPLVQVKPHLITKDKWSWVLNTFKYELQKSCTHQGIQGFRILFRSLSSYILFSKMIWITLLQIELLLQSLRILVKMDCFFETRFYVPDVLAWLQVLQHFHDIQILARHFGFHKTIKLITWNYWWSQFRSFVEDYVRTCDVCCQSKIFRHQPYGLLHPLLTPTGP